MYLIGRSKLGDDEIGRLLLGDGGTGEMVEPFGEQARRDARIVE